jgi:hypothetical protein
MFEKLKKWLSPDTPNLGSGETDAPKQPEVKKKSTPKKPELTDKEKATAAGEPYIAITSVEIDPNDINNGSFDLDWNDKFVLNLVKQGYRIKKEDTDAMIVDRWFQTVCRNIALEVYEQDQADPTNRDMTSDMRIIRSRDLGDGRTEVS